MKETIITAFKTVFSTDMPHYITLERAVDRIKEGVSKDLIAQIRKTEDKEKRNNLKKKLPAFCFNGKFTARNADALVEHSGFMVVDMDNIPSNEQSKEWEQLINNPYVLVAFVSPSNGVGNKYGFKALVKIDKCDAVTHSKVFEAFQEKYDFKYWDNVNKDVSRVCFESYDPNIYINYECKTFRPILKDEGFSVNDRVPLLPITDENRIIEKILAWDWKKNFVDGQKNNFVFDLAGAFCEYGIDQNTAESFLYNNVIAGSCKDEQGKINSVRSAYKKRSFGSKFFEDFKRKKDIKYNLKKGKAKILKEFKIDEDTYDKLKEENEVENFWYYDEKDKLKINPLKYKLFLESKGFKKYFPSDTEKPNWVYIESNKVSEISTEKIKDFVLDYLAEAKEFDVWNYCAQYQNLFSEGFLLMLDSIDLIMMRDTKHKSFIAFRNGILEVTKDNIKLVDYLDIEAYIWKSNIIDREFVLTEEIKNEYQQFINNISDGKPEPIECVLGYLISRYKNKMNNKAVILNDEVISDNPEGGTGKGLFVQGLRQIRKVSILDGKTFDDKKSFPYQTVSQDSDILVFDDIKKNFDFENKFSLVTEGMTLERKNKDAIKLSVEESPKLVLSTNYAVKGEGNSHDRRRHEVEVSQYYGKNLTPFDEFGHQLFDDWDADHFNRFDNYMVRCLQTYLNKGLIPQQAKNLDMRKFIAETSMEFHEWITETDNFPLNTRNDKAGSFDKFIFEYKDYVKWLSRKKFNIWVKKYASFIKAEYRDGITQGQRWFEIVSDETQSENNTNDEAPF